MVNGWPLTFLFSVVSKLRCTAVLGVACWFRDKWPPSHAVIVNSPWTF